LGGAGGGSERGLPRKCDAPAVEGQKKECPLDPYLIIHSKSTFADQQILKLQEAPDMVPVGELPRHMLLSVDRYLTGKVVPGSRIVATGIYSSFQSAKNVCVLCDPDNDHNFKKIIRKLLVHSPSANPIYVLFILSCLRPPAALVDLTHLVFNLRQKRRKNLVKWPEAQDSMNDLREVLHPVFMEVSVRECSPLLAIAKKL
jgi:DNA replicative helicase MCM subunit Mcm2 (Cdc46/Mcm family)